MSQTLSRAIARLDVQIAEARDPVQADCLRAERAIYLARMGDLAVARNSLAEVRAKYSGHPRADTSGWIALAEGIAKYFDDLGDAARDQILRAQALARSARLDRLDALSSAWLAHVDFSKFSTLSMRKNVEHAIALAQPSDHAVMGRAAMVVAYCLHFADLQGQARPWYQFSHWHATKEGDLSSVSALLHNFASFQLSSLRQAFFRRGVDPTGGAQLLLAAESNQYFDEMVGAKALSYLTPLLKSQVLVLLGRFDEAIPALDSHLAGPRSADRFRSLYLAERAWCHLQLGRSSLAEVDAAASAEAVQQGQADDRASTHSRLNLVFMALDRDSAAEHHTREADEAWRAHEEAQRSFAAAFGVLSLPPLPTVEDEDGA